MIKLMKKLSAAQQGLTIIELLLVVSLITILAASGAPFASSFLLRNLHDTSVDRILGGIRKAQAYSMSGRSNGQWGVCMANAQTFRMYRGTCLTPDQAEDFPVPGTVSVGGMSDVTFTSDRGVPSTTLSVVITSQAQTTTITLNNAGGIDVD